MAWILGIVCEKLKGTSTDFCLPYFSYCIILQNCYSWGTFAHRWHYQTILKKVCEFSKRNLLGKYINTDDVGDDSTESQNRHSDAFHPKSAALDGAIFIHIQVAAMTRVQVWIRCRSIRSTFIEAFKGLIFFHSFQMPFGLRTEEDWRLEDAQQASSLRSTPKKKAASSLSQQAHKRLK